MILEIEHSLRFAYDAYIRESYMEVRVEPRRSPRQTLLSFHLAVGPPTPVWRYLDWNGNFVHHFGILEFHDRIEVVTRSVIETRPSNDVDVAMNPGPAGEAAGTLLDFSAFGGPVRRSPELEALAREIPVGPEAPVEDQARAIGSLVFERFDYRQEVTNYRSTSDHILDVGGGVCQDFTHVTLALLRLRGIPCRYVNGYLHVDALSGEPAQSHAWVEFYSPTAGWLAMDPTHDRAPNESYVILAYGRHYDDVPPNRGIFRGAASETLFSEVRTREVPRPAGLSMQDEIGELEIPVFASAPSRGETPPGSEHEAEADSQQQQQQQ